MTVEGFKCIISRFRVMCRTAFFLVILWGTGVDSMAQTGQQLWLEWQVSYPFGTQYLLENTMTYQTLLSGGEKWRGFSISPTFEYTFKPVIDLTAEIPIGFTRQTDSRTSFEISPLVGARFHVTQNRRVNFRILPRFQSRNFQSLETGEWELKGRFRLKGEVWIAINRPTLFHDKLAYTFVDYEEFIVVEEQVQERYANLRRFRIGVGYRLNYMHRLDLMYTWQYSRDETGVPFDQIDSVIQLKYKMFLNPSTAEYR